MPSVFSRSALQTYKERLWHKRWGQPYRLHVYDHGAPQPGSPVIILLHGLASSSADWNNLIPLLSDTHHCITIELLGFGNSPKPQWASYSMQEHLRSIDMTVRRMRLRRPFILVGHSLGSLLATRYAREHPSHIERLVLLSPPVYAPLGTIASRAARQRTSMYLKAYRFLRTHKSVTPENIMRLTRLLPRIGFVIADKSVWIPFIRSLEQCIENQTLIADIKGVAAPVDIFYGVFDEVVVPYNIKQLARIHGAQLHPLRVNHVVGKRYAAAVAKTLHESRQNA